MTADWHLFWRKWPDKGVSIEPLQIRRWGKKEQPCAEERWVQRFDRQLSTLSAAWQAAFVYWAVRRPWHLFTTFPSHGGDGCVHMTFHEHFTSWICRWQTQLNPQPQPIAALAWQSHCGSRWCPLGALQRQGDRGQGFKRPTSDTGCILAELNHAVSTQQDQWHLWVS